MLTCAGEFSDRNDLLSARLFWSDRTDLFDICLTSPAKGEVEVLRIWGGSLAIEFALVDPRYPCLELLMFADGQPLVFTREAGRGGVLDNGRCPFERRVMIHWPWDDSRTAGVRSFFPLWSGEKHVRLGEEVNVFKWQVYVLDPVTHDRVVKGGYQSLFKLECVTPGLG